MEKLLGKIQPLTPGQEEILKAFADKNIEIIGLFGPTGSGKSLFSILYGLECVLENKYRRFIISRPVIDVATGRELSAADIGEMYYKLASSYIADVVGDLVDIKVINQLMEEGKLVFADSHYLRGRTFDDSIIFLDDAQSIPVEGAIEVIMRLGRNSRLIIAGDPVFQRTVGKRDSASLLREVLLGEEDAKVIDLGLKDIVRPGAKRGIKLLLESIMRSRPLSEFEKIVINTMKVYSPDADIVTAIELVELKKKYDIKSENTPDIIIVVKEGHIAKAVGKGGERVTKAEKDLGHKIRLVEATLDFKQIIRAVHPVSWIYKHIVDVDFAGPNLQVKVSGDNYGAFVGTKGAYVRFLDEFFRRLLGAGVKVYEVAETPKKK